MMANTAKNLGIGKGFRLYCCFIFVLYLAVVKFFTFISLQARIKAKPLIRMTYSNGYKSRYHQQLQQQQQQQQQAQVCNRPTRGGKLSQCVSGRGDGKHAFIDQCRLYITFYCTLFGEIWVQLLRGTHHTDSRI